MRKMEFNVSNKIARLQMIPRTTEENEQAEEETHGRLLQTFTVDCCKHGNRKQGDTNTTERPAASQKGKRGMMLLTSDVLELMKKRTQDGRVRWTDAIRV